MVSPVNASRRPSRDAAHHSGSGRMASPYEHDEIARKTGLTVEYVKGVISLLEIERINGVGMTVRYLLPRYR